MDFSPSPGPLTSPPRVGAFIAEEIEPVEAAYHRDLAEQRRTGDPWRPLPVLAGAQGQGPGAGAVEPVPAAGARGGVRRAVRHRRRRGAVERRLRADRGADRALGDRAAGAQLQRPRHREHGGAAALRLRAAAQGVAGAAPRRPDPLRVRDDRARGRLLRRHQHGGHRRRRRRRGGRQRTQVVVDGRRQPRLQGAGLHGARADPDADRHHRHSMVLVPREAPGREGRAAAEHDGRVRRAARPRRGVVHRRAGAARERASAGRGRRSRSPRAGSARAGCTTACG